MKRRLMEFILKEAGEENETMHFIMYGSLSTQRSVYDGIDEPEFYDIAVKKIVDGKETDFESKVVTFSGHKLTNIDCAEQTFASIVRNDKDTEVIYLDPEVKALAGQYTEKTALESGGRKIAEYCYSAAIGACKLYLATDEFLYYERYGESVMFSTEDGHVVADNSAFAEMGLWESFKNVEDGKEKLLYGEIPEEYTAYRQVIFLYGSGNDKVIMGIGA